MVHLRVQSVISLKLHKKFTNSASDIANESVCGMHLKMLSKMVLMDAKSGQLKTEKNIELFSAPGDVQESANRTTVNAFQVRLMIQLRVSPDNTPGVVPKGALQDLYKDAQKGAPEEELKGALQVLLELNLFMQCIGV